MAISFKNARCSSRFQLPETRNACSKLIRMDPDLRWRPLYFLAPLLIFVYMTCDAVDGKHARHTGQSSVLGAVVDHGIDAFCAFTTGVAVTVTADPELRDPMLMLAGS